MSMLSQLRTLSKAAGPVRAALASQQFGSAGIASSAVAQDKIVAVLYKAGEASQEKRLLGASAIHLLLSGRTMHSDIYTHLLKSIKLLSSVLVGF